MSDELLTDSLFQTVSAKKGYKNRRIALYMCFLYQKNYENEDRETKRQIREYYEENLRYKGAFYRDRRIFNQYGNPLEWETNKIKRYKLEEQEFYYRGGFNYFKTFQYQSQFLLQLSAWKETDYLLIDLNDSILDINNYYAKLIKRDLKQLDNFIDRVDKQKGEYVIKGYKGQTKLAFLGQRRTIFKLWINREYIIHISTRYIERRNFIQLAIGKLQNYLDGLVELDNRFLAEGETNPSNIFDDNFNLKRVELIEIFVCKRTDKANMKVLKGRWKDINYQTRTLSSLEIYKPFTSKK